MRVLTILCCLLTASGSYAQDAHMLLKFAPLAMFDEVSFPTVQTGLEVALTSKISWYNEVGIRYRKTSGERAVDTSFISITGYKLKSEFRYYFTGLWGEQVERLWGWYAGINFFYTRTTNNANVNYYYQKDVARLTEDHFGVRKSVWGSNVIVGRQSDIGEYFQFDMYGGCGVRSSDFVTVGQEFQSGRDELVKGSRTNLNVRKWGAAANGENKTLLNFTLGIRFAYRLF